MKGGKPLVPADYDIRALRALMEGEDAKVLISHLLKGVRPHIDSTFCTALYRSFLDLH